MPRRRFSKIETPAPSGVPGADGPEFQRRIEPATGEREHDAVELSLDLRAPVPPPDEPLKVAPVMRPADTPARDRHNANPTAANQSIGYRPASANPPRPAGSSTTTTPPSGRPNRPARNRRVPTAHQMQLDQARKRLRNAWIFLLLLLGIPGIVALIIYAKLR